MIYTALSKLPFSALYPVSSFLSFVLYHLLRYRRSISYNNLSRSFPEKSSQEIIQLQKSSYRHLTDTFLEVLKANTVSDEEIESRVELINFDEIEADIKNQRSIFFLTAHTAPTDWIAFAMHIKYGCLIDPVYKPVHSKRLDSFIYASRSRHQGTPIPYKKIAKDIIHRKQVTRCVGMLADLEPRSRDQALEINFLHQPTRFFLGSERIIKLAQFPTYFIGVKQTRRGHYQAYAEKLCEQPTDMPAEALTRNYIACVEKLILENPADWLWTHRRWKHRPNA